MHPCTALQACTSLATSHLSAGVNGRAQEPTESLLVVVEDDGKKCGLLVDDLSGQQQVVIKNLGEGLGQVKGVSGAAIMGDGKASLILDIPGLIDLARRT